MNATFSVPFISIDTVKYFYRQSGPDGQPQETIIFLHGSGGDGTVWDAQVSGLGTHYNIIIPDMPGHGRSEGKKSNTREYTQWLKNFIAALKLSGVFLVGHSLGGAIAQEYAGLYPHKLKGLVLVGTGMSFSIAEEYLELLQNDFETAIKISCKNAYTSPVSARVYQKGYAMLQRNGKEILYRDMLACRQFDSSLWVSSINTPALVICGQRDSIMPCEYAWELSQRMPASSLSSIPGAGHMVMVQIPEEFNKSVKRFIEKTIQAV